MLERLAHLTALCVVACTACGAQSSAPPERSPAAADDGFVEADIARRATPKPAAVIETQCPATGAELPGSPLWLNSYDAAEISGLASDSAGNIVVAFSGSELLKLSCAGTLLWSKPFGAHVAIDDRDNIYVAGTFTGTLTVGADTLQAAGSAAFVVKLDAAGNVAYARVLGQAPDGAIESVAVDGQGNVALSGSGFGTAKLGELGNLLWQKTFSGKVQFDGGGNLLLAGELVGTLDLEGASLISQGGADVLLLKLDPDGTPLFAHRYGDAGALQRAQAIAVDDQDNVVVAGTFDGRVDFGAGALPLAPAQCSSDAWCVTNGFAAKFDAQGQAAWSVAFGPMRAMSGAAVDSNGNSVLSGALPGGVRPFRQTWLAKLDTNGAQVWQRAEWPDTGIGAGGGVAVDSDARVFWSLNARPSLELEERSYLALLTP